MVIPFFVFFITPNILNQTVKTYEFILGGLKKSVQKIPPNGLLLNPSIS